MPSQKDKRAKGVQMTEQQLPFFKLQVSVSSQDSFERLNFDYLGGNLQYAVFRWNLYNILGCWPRPLTSVFISESTLFPPVNGPTVPSREVWLYTLENGKN
jgi:hypothetical protein